jgi:hypothetical protein
VAAVAERIPAVSLIVVVGRPIAAVAVVEVVDPMVAVVAEQVVERKIVDVREARWGCIVSVEPGCRLRSARVVVGLGKIGRTRGEEVGAAGSRSRAHRRSSVAATCMVVG